MNGYTQDKFDLIDSKELISIDHKNLGANITSCSILGSFLSQEIVKAVSRVGTPGCNVFVFHGADMIVKAVPIAVAM